MKNSLILDLQRSLANTKDTTVSTDESYKLFQNFRKLTAAAKELTSAIQDLIKADGPKQDEKGNIDLQDPQSQTFKDHYQELLNDETEVTLKRMHWEGFDAFCKENGFVGADINALADMLLIEEDLNDQSE